MSCLIIKCNLIYYTLEACIDDERQFKTAKRPHAPGDATVLKRFFRNNILFFFIFRRRSKRVTFLESVSFLRVYMQIFNFCDSHVTTFRHPSGAYICQIPGHRLHSKRHTIRVLALVWGKNCFL